MTRSLFFPAVIITKNDPGIAYLGAGALSTLFFIGLLLAVAGFRLYGKHEVAR